MPDASFSGCRHFCLAFGASLVRAFISTIYAFSARCPPQAPQTYGNLDPHANPPAHLSDVLVNFQLGAATHFGYHAVTSAAAHGAVLLA